MTMQSMKLSLRWLIALGASVSGIAAVPVQADESGWNGFVEGSYLMEDGDRTRPVGNYDDANDVFIGGVDVTRPDGGAFGAGIGYDFGVFDIGLKYQGSWLNDNVSEDSDPPGSVLFTQLNSHLLGVPVGYLTVDVAEDWNRHVLDFMVGYDVWRWEGGGINLSGGIKYARISRDLEAEGPIAADFSMTEERHEDLAGVGPAIAAHGHLALSEEFRLVGGMGGSLLFADRDTENSYTILNTATGAVLTSEAEERDGADTIYNMNGELGIAYVPFMPGGTEFMVTLGYRMDAWWNVQDSNYNQFNVLGDLEGDRGSRNGDALSHGPFLRLGVRF